MQVTMAMLYDGFEERAVCEKGSAYDGETDVSLLTIAEPSMRELLLETTLIVDANDEETFERACSLFGAHHVISVGRTSQACAIQVLDPLALKTVHLFAEEIVARYRKWAYELTEIVLQNDSLEVLLDKAHDLFRNPLVVHDRALRVRARTTQDVMHDEMWNPLDPHEEMFEGYAEAPGFEEFVNTLKSDRVVSDFRMFNGIRVAACRTREIGDNFLFVSLIQKKRIITEGDVCALKYLCELVGVLVKTELVGETEDIGLNGLLMDGFEGNITSPVELANRFRAVSLPLKKRLLVIRLTTRKGRLNDRQAHHFVDDIMHNFPLDHGFPYADGLVFFSTFDVGKGMNNIDYRRLRTFVQDRNLIAGVGEESSVGVPLRETYQKALYALVIGRKVFPESCLFFFEDLRAFYLYEVCAREGNEDMFIHPAIARTARAERKSKTSLQEVLRRLVKNHGNRAKTARELFIQRNTLQARIKEIERLCGIDLSDPQTILHIKQSFELLDYLSSTYSHLGF